jgi:hypothetical protein
MNHFCNLALIICFLFVRQPPEEVKQQEAVSEAPDPIREPIREARIRPDVNEPLITLKADVTKGLSKRLESLSASKVAVNEEENAAVAIGSACHNTGCQQKYDGTNLTGECMFHDGSAIFHEGMKYWSCCQRKTSDFNAFLDQAGCTAGKHVWRKVKVQPQDLDRSRTCRLDWYQTGDVVVVSIYSKLPIPTESLIQANAVKLSIRITFGEDRQPFEQDIVLFGIIDVSKSEVSFKETKVEITLKKDELVSWSRINY